MYGVFHYFSYFTLESFTYFLYLIYILYIDTFQYAIHYITFASHTNVSNKMYYVQTMVKFHKSYVVYQLQILYL